MVVAGSITAVLHKVSVILHFLRLATGQIAFTLLCHHISYVSPLGLEIVAHRFRLIFAALVLKHRRTYYLSCSVGTADGIHRAFLHIHLQLVGCEVYFAINDL